MARSRTLALVGLYCLAGAAALLSGTVLFRVHPMKGELERLSEELRAGMETPTEPTLETTVACPRTGEDVLVKTPRNSRPKTEWIADHQETVGLVKDDCATTTAEVGAALDPTIDATPQPHLEPEPEPAPEAAEPAPDQPGSDG